jgi:putative oxygen-independent coproporphyrinogen III oxidase
VGEAAAGGTAPERCRLAPTTAGPAPAPGFGVYVHVPFCASRCDYCAFATWTDRHHLAERYVGAVVAEARAAELPPATSCFVGGGTPSQLPAELVAEILGAVPLAPGAEVTVECNPDDAAEALLDTWRAAGVTRISLGVQSLDPRVLAGLGRRHGVEAVRTAAALVRSRGFASWNLDLILGGAGEDDLSWRRTLEGALALDPPHLSAYCLTVEAGTPLAADPDRHPDDDALADRYLLADDVLTAAGRQWYEVSNWARPGHECRHNRLYWEQGDYRGLGCAAHSHAGGRRWWNVRTPERYCAAIEAGVSPTAGEEVLDVAARIQEALELGLRTRDGVPGSALDLDDPALEGLVSADGGRAVLTPRGRLLASEVALRLRRSAPAG